MEKHVINSRVRGRLNRWKTVLRPKVIDGEVRWYNITPRSYRNLIAELERLYKIEAFIERNIEQVDEALKKVEEYFNCNYENVKRG